MMHSAANSHSWTVADIPRFNGTDVGIYSNAARTLRSCITLLGNLKNPGIDADMLREAVA